MTITFGDARAKVSASSTPLGFPHTEFGPMKRNTTLFAATLAFFAMPLLAQNPPANDSTDKGTTAAAPKDSAAKPAAVLSSPKIEIQHMRALDQRGINVFETPKQDDVAYEGFKLAWGAAFTQQYQNLSHANTASAKLVNGVDQNKLIGIGGGFNNA